MVNPGTGRMITVGGFTHTKLVADGKLPPTAQLRPRTPSPSTGNVRHQKVCQMCNKYYISHPGKFTAVEMPVLTAVSQACDECLALCKQNSKNPAEDCGSTESVATRARTEKASLLSAASVAAIRAAAARGTSQ